jgi:hypothetical protein
MNPELPLWIGSAFGVVLIVVLFARQAIRRGHRHPAE